MSSWNCSLTRLPMTAAPPGYPSSPRSVASGIAVASACVGGTQLPAVLGQPRGHEADRIVHDRERAGAGGRLARVALVADPHVAVVVVAALLRTLGQRSGCRGDHSAAAGGHAADHRAGVRGVARRDRLLELGRHARCQACSVSRHAASGVRPGSALAGRLAIVSTRSWCSPAESSRSSSRARWRPALTTRASAAPLHVSCRPSRRARHTPCSSRARSRMPWRPNAARGSSIASSRQLPRRAAARQRIVTRSGSAGNASASRHSTIASTCRPAIAPDQAARFVVAPPYVPLDAGSRRRCRHRRSVPRTAARSPSAGSTSRPGRRAGRRSRRAHRPQAARTRAACAACSATPGRSSAAGGRGEPPPQPTAVAGDRGRAVHCQPQLRAARRRLLVEAAVRRGQPGHRAEQVGGPVRGHRQVRDLLRVIAGSGEVAVGERWREVGSRGSP